MPNLSENKPSNSNKKPTDVLFEKATDSFKWWNNLATLNKADSIGMSIFKIFIRIIGIILMVALSPVALLAILIAFLTVL